MNKELVFASLFVCALLAAACSSNAAPASPLASVSPTSAPPTPTSAPTARVLRVGLTSYPDVLDPQRAPLGTEAHLLKLVYEGLTTIDEKGNVSGGGADKWTSSPDGLQMTFHIREGLKRADGTAITARDYEYALKRALDPRITNKSNTFLLYDIKGAEEVDKLDPAKTKPEDIDKALNNLGIKVTDNQNLVLTFKKPNGYWQAVAATLAAFPSDKKSVDRDPDNWWFSPDAHNGTGAFVVKSIEQNKRIILAPNPNYWRGKPKLDRLELVYFPWRQRACSTRTKKGDIDLATNLSADDLNVINADATLKSELVRVTDRRRLRDCVQRRAQTVRRQERARRVSRKRLIARAGCARRSKASASRTRAGFRRAFPARSRTNPACPSTIRKPPCRRSSTMVTPRRIALPTIRKWIARNSAKSN